MIFQTRPLTAMLPALLAAAIALGVLLTVPAGPAQAQNLFAPVVTINGRTVTRYELEQRIAFLRVLRAPGNLEKEAEKVLIDERLQVQAAQAAGITLTPEALKEGMTEFASRANLELDPFVEAIGQAGVDAETFRDFVSAGMMWREFVRARFGTQARVTEAEVDRQLAAGASQSSARVLLSRIVLPARPEQPGEVDAAHDLARELQATIRGQDAFADAARQYSVAPERLSGGRIDWISISELPPQLVPLLLTLAPGRVSDPIPVGTNAIAVFQLRALEEIGPRPVANVSVDYVTVTIPGAGTPAAEARAAELARADGCNALYPMVRNAPQDTLARQTVTTRSLPRDLGLEIALLDPGEASASLTRDGGRSLLFVMLCNRTPTAAEDPAAAREAARLELYNQRLQSLSDGYLEGLRADAFLSRP